LETTGRFPCAEVFSARVHAMVQRFVVAYGQEEV
jgi:hypothetical protein